MNPDNIFNGNYLSGLTCIYGEAGTGVTTCCLTAAITAAKTGSVLYIATEEFPAGRLAQLTTDTTILQNIRIIDDTDSLASIQGILAGSINNAYALIVIDSLLKLAYSEFDGTVESKIYAYGCVGQILRHLAGLGMPCIITSRVYDDVKHGTQRMIGGSVVWLLSDNIILLKKSNRWNKMIIEKPAGVVAKYRLGMTGLERVRCTPRRFG